MNLHLYPRMLDAAPDALLLTDGDGTIRWANAAAERMFGHARTDLLGASIELLVPSRFRQAHVEHRSRFSAAPRARGMGSNLDLFALHRDGSEFPVEVSLSPLQSDAGPFVLSALRDVSARREADLSTLLLAAIVDSSDDAIVSTTLDGVISSWNPGATRIFGYSADEIIGHPISVLAADAAAEREQAALIDRILRGEQVEPYEAVRRRRDDSEVHLTVRLSPIRAATGELRGISSTARDISERRLIEQRARAVGQQLMSAVESFQGMFALYASDDYISVCNSAFREFFEPAVGGPVTDVRFDALVQQSLRAGLFDLGAISADQLAAHWIAQHRGAAEPLELRTADGRTLRVRDRATADGGVVCTIWDITDDIARESELRRAHAAAESASAAKSEFLASVSHELRTPLNAILGFAQLLGRDKKAPLDGRQRDRVAHIIKGGEHLLRLIEDVLDFARIEAGRVIISIESIGLRDVIREVVSTLEPMASERNVRMEVEVAGEIEIAEAAPRVRADRVRASQILMNFGTNAIKYGSDGGLVRFRVGPGRADTLRISVLDRGKGIALEQQSKLFQPFQRAGQELGPIEGTGIGLMICKRLATMMQGEVGFTSEPGVGSEFWLELPIQQGAGAEVLEWHAAPARDARRDGAEHTVVYIEDNPSNIALMASVMEELGRIALITAHTAELGIELVRAHRPDVVLMDINLPGMSGIAAARKLREWPETRRIPVVALTAAALFRDSKRNDLNVFDRYLTKPLKVDELTDTLNMLFERGAEPSLPASADSKPTPA